MNKTRHYFLFFIIFAFTNIAITAEEIKTDEPKAKLLNSADFQEVINNYKAYVAQISPEIRNEVIAYRTEIAQINKQKKILYKKLSQASQNYLKKEQQYKQKLPLDRKKLISINGQDASNADKKEDNSQKTNDEERTESN